MTKIKNPLRGEQISLLLVRSTCKKCKSLIESPILDHYCSGCFWELTKDRPPGVCGGWIDHEQDPPFWHQVILFTPADLEKSPNSSPELGDFSGNIDDPQKLVSTSDSQKSPNCCDELGDFLPPLPGKYLSCRKIKHGWVGSIECKTIKGKQYYYWRHRKKGNFGDSTLASDYLGSTWKKSLKTLDRLQSQRMRE
jgi:hypothetical protein